MNSFSDRTRSSITSIRAISLSTFGSGIVLDSRIIFPSMWHDNSRKAVHHVFEPWGREFVVFVKVESEISEWSWVHRKFMVSKVPTSVDWRIFLTICLIFMTPISHHKGGRLMQPRENGAYRRSRGRCRLTWICGMRADVRRCDSL